MRKLKNRLKSLEAARIAVIGGSGFEKLFMNAEGLHLQTPYGMATLFPIGIGSRHVIFLPRHGTDHSVPPHKIEYRTNVWALHQIGVERILATNAVGAINRKFKPGDLIIPHDFIDFTKCRNATFYDEAPVTHIDLSQPYCPELRKRLIEAANKTHVHVSDRAVLVCTEGPRFETPAEIRMLNRLGGDVVGMTGLPEASLARELKMCYATVCHVSNMTAGIQERLSCAEFSRVSRPIYAELEKVLIETIGGLPLNRKRTCPCAKATEDARFR